jgi:hypothetical protein
VEKILNTYRFSLQDPPHPGNLDKETLEKFLSYDSITNRDLDQ